MRRRKSNLRLIPLIFIASILILIASIMGYSTKYSPSQSLSSTYLALIISYISYITFLASGIVIVYELKKHGFKKLRWN